MANRLRTVREDSGISQSELARTLEVSRQALSAIETLKQEPSLALALRISKVLNVPVEQIFLVEDEEMEAGRKQGLTLTRIERQLLVNQYQILQGIHEKDNHLVKYYKHLEEIFGRGYEYLYREAFEDLWTPLPIEISKEVLSILDMHRAMFLSLGSKPDPAYLEQVQFKGFDGNNEGQHLGFAHFFCDNGERYKELRIFNSHFPTLKRYRRMLDEWERMDRAYPLTKPQIDSILEAGDLSKSK